MIFEGEIALVTGASRGIGSAVARALAEEGATVIGTATGSEGVQAIERSLASAPVPGTGMVLDVSDPDSVSAGFAALAERGTMPGILVNNAGISQDTLLARMSEEQWQSVIETDLGSVYRTCKESMRYLMKRRRGRIVNITSVVGFIGNAGQTNYAAAKAGIVGFTRALAREVGPRGITVNAVAPGFIDTDMTRSLTLDQRDRLTQSVPLGRFGLAEDIAAAVVFLASPAAGYITGETLHVNGGMYMG
ncbi:MAG: 3-oxoacyl-ACP reductase FabG [Ectothiorhodospiraceae bacterium AqS1]|nr:3-oxoacyl-ACP reductase FabG [Ectothiorhodospiraceae bacterium AqS1]